MDPQSTHSSASKSAAAAPRQKAWPPNRIAALLLTLGLAALALYRWLAGSDDRKTPLLLGGVWCSV